jgi:prepilin-type processing-associated H-X9-DG protein
MKERNNGMTVVELVVVVAVIAFLIMLLFPAGHHHGENARRANCVSNLKQIGLGIAQYYDDNTNQMPPMASVQAFATAIAPYIGHSPKLFVCPQDKTLKPAANIGNLTESSYAWIPTAAWLQTNMMPMVFDKFQTSGLTTLTGRNTWSPKSPHEGEGGNVLWTDGHADWNRSLDVGTNRYPVVND